MTHGPLRDSKSDLLHAAQAAVKDREEKNAEYALAGRARPRRRRRLGAMVVIGVAGGVLLAVQPAWLVGPKAVPPEPAPVSAAGLRIALIRQRQLVFNYARAHGGRLPLSLAESGDSLEDVSYQHRGDSGFTLTGSTADSVVVLQSGDSQAVFLGNSLKILKDRGRP